MQKIFSPRVVILVSFIFLMVCGLIWITPPPQHVDGELGQVKIPIQQKDQLRAKALAIPTNSLLSTPTKYDRQNIHRIIQKKADQDDARDKKQVAIQAGQRILDQFKQMKSDQNKNASGMLHGLPRGRGHQVSDPKQQKAIDSLLEQLGPKANLQMDNLSRTLRFLKGDLSRLVQNSASYKQARMQNQFSGMALALIENLAPVMNHIDPKEEFVPQTSQEDDLGMAHVVLQQQYDGVPVWGAQVGVHFDKEKNPVQVSGVYAPLPGAMKETAQWISREDALQHARKGIAMQGTGYAPDRIERMIYWDIDRVPVQAYKVELTPSALEHWIVFVSAQTGEMIHRSKSICTTAAVGQSPDLEGVVQTVNSWQEGTDFLAIDTSKPMYSTSSQPPDIRKTKGAIVVLDAENKVLEQTRSFKIASTRDNNQWDPTVVSVLKNYGLVEAYYRRTFNRNSIDDKGMNIMAIVHARFSSPDGSITSDNAFWNPGAQLMVFGDGESAFIQLPASLDVTGHELTHGVINHSANLIYENQAGALNEHIADFFGAMVDRDEWLLGDGVTRGKDGLRDMENPKNSNILSRQPSVMSEYQNLPNTPQGDNGGVHINSGIPNHMAFLLAEGPEGIGRDKAEQIIYRALTTYMTQRSQFIDYRRAAVSAAGDLYGENSPEVEAVKKAFDAVEIFDEGSDAPYKPTPGTPTSGNEVALFLLQDPLSGVDPIRNDSFYQLAIHANGDNLLLTPRLVVNTRPAASGDGNWILYVDATNNIYWTDGTSEQQWTDKGIIRSIAMSKDLRYIVFTTVDFDNFITIIDTVSDQVSIADLFVTRMDGVNQPLDFADVMTFNFRGDALIYDAVMQLQVNENESYPVWGIYSMRMVDQVSQQMVAQTPGEELGNPTIANTNDYLLLADYILTDGEEQTYSMVAIDFLRKDAGILLGPLNGLAQPTFRGDDQGVIFRGTTESQSEYALLAADLIDDGLTLDQNSTQVLFQMFAPLSYPHGFRIGEYTPQHGQISAPQALAFGEVPFQSHVPREISISNIGNADLSLIDMTIEGTSKESFSHTGINQMISPGQSISFQVICSPQQVGNLSATLKIKSTDVNQPETVVQLSGMGTAADTPTPTATRIVSTPTLPPTTPTPLRPTPTPVEQANETPVPSDAITPIAVYEFDQSTLEESGWFEIPGGFDQAEPGTVEAVSFDPALFSTSQDQKGIIFTMNPKEVSLLSANVPIDTGGKPVLLRMKVRAESAQVSVFLVALKGATATGEQVDGSLAYNNPTQAASFVDQEKQLVLVYEPDQGHLFTPMIQVVGTGEETSKIYIDRLEIYSLEPDINYPGKLFSSSVN